MTVQRRAGLLKYSNPSRGVSRALAVDLPDRSAAQPTAQDRVRSTHPPATASAKGAAIVPTLPRGGLPAARKRPIRGGERLKGDKESSSMSKRQPRDIVCPRCGVPSAKVIGRSESQPVIYLRCDDCGRTSIAPE